TFHILAKWPFPNRQQPIGALGGFIYLPKGSRQFAIWNKCRLHYLAILKNPKILLRLYIQQLKTRRTYLQYQLSNKMRRFAPIYGGG
ncbi:MAG: hypothetical protein ACYSU8_11545, partial [Planctomycetota bacterium]